MAIRTCRGKPRYVRHGQASAQCSRGCLMRLARAAVAEASRAPPAGADAASTALRGAARTVGFVSATLNPPDPVTPGETRHQCSHIATLPRPRNTRPKTLVRYESRRNERARACVCCPAQFSFSFAPNMQVLMADILKKILPLPLASKVGLCLCFGKGTCRACCDTTFPLRDRCDPAAR